MVQLVAACEIMLNFNLDRLCSTDLVIQHSRGCQYIIVTVYVMWVHCSDESCPKEKKNTQKKKKKTRRSCAFDDK